MSYSFIAVADVHLGWKLFNLPELAQDLKDTFARVVDLAISLKVDYLFIAGDLFDTNKPSPDLVKFVKAQVKKLGMNGCIAAGIAGDHDKPINEASWIDLGNVIPINDLNDHRFVGYDYCDTSAHNVEALAKLEYKKEVEWVFLHGQVPGLFNFCAEKKLLDLKRLDVINNFPNLKGFILGDIHSPTETVIHDPKQERKTLPYLGYCGSLGVTKVDEVSNKKGILYYNGKELKRVNFELDRKFIPFEMGKPEDAINWVNKFQRFFLDWKAKKPVFIVDYNKDTKAHLHLLSPLYDVGIVKTKVSRKVDGEGSPEVINIRSELKTTDRATRVLKQIFPEKELFDIASKLISQDDPTLVLDKFKEEATK